AEGPVLGRGHAMALHEGLGEGLGAFELGRPLRRTENGQAMRAELVHHAGGQWRLGPDHRQADAVGLHPLAQRHLVADGHVHQLRVAGRARVARCHIDLAHALGLLELPRQGMLAATAADHQDFHASISALWKTSWTSSRSSRASRSFCMRSASSPVSSMVFSGRIVTSATSAFRPAASSAFFTASKSPGALSTSMEPSSPVITSSAPASRATSITLSSLVPGANISCPQCLNWNATEP